MIRVFNQYVSAKSVLLIVNEGFLVAISFFVAAKLRFWSDPVGFEVFTTQPDFGIQVLVNVIVFQVCFYYNELYTLKVRQSSGEMFVRLWQGLGSSCILLGLLYWIAPVVLIGRGVLFISMVVLLPVISLSRTMLDFAWRATLPVDNVLILGTGELAGTVARELKRRTDLRMSVAGFAPTGKAVSPRTFFGGEILGSADDLEQIVKQHNIRQIIVALEDHRGTIPVRSLVNIRVQGVPVKDAHTALAALTGRVWLSTVRPSWFVYAEGFHRSKTTVVLKRIIDFCFAVVGLVVSSPVMALTALAVRLDSRGPIFYSQTRVGLKGREFQVLKFRSMRTDAEAITGPQWASANDPRTTRIGKYLRKYRLDELPQFINVIRGEMSFVGPRPPVPEEVERYERWQRRRLRMKPGLTCLWALEGRSELDFRRWMRLDIDYIEQWSLLLDFKILCRTIPRLLSGRGAS